LVVVIVVVSPSVLAVYVVHHRLEKRREEKRREEKRREECTMTIMTAT